MPLVDEPPLAAAVAITVAMAEPILVESATDTAVIVTVAGVGTVMGAVYTPDAEIIPTVALPPAVPLTLQLTAVLEAPVTAAVNVCVIPTVTLMVAGVTDTVIGAATVTVADADFVVSAADVALIVTAAGAGTVDGAV
jgi:hypothetical protein